MIDMSLTHLFMTDKVKIAKKGQITIPKRIREEDGLKESDILVVTHLPGGEIVLRKHIRQDPVDMMLEAIRTSPSINAAAAWEEVKAERRRERA